MNLVRRAAFLLHITHTHGIVRRYFVVNGFDGALTMLGIVWGITAVVQDGRHRGTFLPSVWDSLPEPAAFLQHLKTKAGLPTDYWSDQIRIYRYETESFSAPEAI